MHYAYPLAHPDYLEACNEQRGLSLLGRIALKPDLRFL